MVAFLNNFTTVASQVLVLFLLMIIGFFAGKAKIFNNDTAKMVADFCLKFATPAVIIKSFMREFDPQKAKLLLLALLAAIICHALSLLIVVPLFREREIHDKSLFRASAVLSNAGFMALPLQAALLGDEGTFFGAAYVIIMTVYLWTYGYSTMSMGKETMNLKKIIINPGIISVIIGVPIFLFSVKLPAPITATIGHIANLNTPLPMVVVGFYLSNTTFKIMFKKPKTFLVIITRLLIIPLVCIFVLKLFGFSGTMFISTIIAAAAPIAVAATMFSAMFDGDTELSANMVSVSTLFSIITMPLVVALAETLS